MKAITAFAIVATSIALVLFAVSNDHSSALKQEYQSYKLKFGKSYTSSEQLYRFGLYAKYVANMNQHNSNPNAKWTMGINQFSDLTQEEFIKTYLGEKPTKSARVVDDSITVGAVDWRTKNIVTAIRNQGQCGSCWAFAATAAHETYHVNRSSPLSLHLSEQQLVDCSTGSPYDNHGCGGGYGVHALEYIKDHGQTTNEAYPYKAVDQSCANPSGEYKIVGVGEVTGCTNMENLLNSTPLAVRVDASNWHTYKSGIFDNCDKNINHAVFLVASDASAWTIKNSWGPTWGEEGYIRLAKGDTCAVCFGPSFVF